MKKIIIILTTIVLILLMGMGYTIVRIRDLPNTQSEYLDSAFIMVDHSGYGAGQMKKMYAVDLSPTIDAETETSSLLNRGAIQMRYDDKEGNEYRTDVDLIFPDPNQLSILSIASTDLFYVQDNAPPPGDLYYVSAYGIAVFVKSNQSLRSQSEITNNDIPNTVDSSFIAAEIFNTVTRNIELIYSGSTYGYMSIHRIGYMVCGNVIATQDTETNTYLVTAKLPSWAIPDDMDRPTAIGFTFNNLEGGDDNYLFIQENGDIKILFADIDANTNGISFSWITE